MSARPPLIELRPAHVWDCDACGRENFVRNVIPSFSDDEEDEMRQLMEVSPDEDGLITMIPDQVKCPHCGAEFRTMLMFETEDQVEEMYDEFEQDLDKYEEDE
jgi:uncharacterized protein with PIN domain